MNPQGTSTTATETLWSKENRTENSKRENAKEKAESVKTEQSIKTKNFEVLPWLKSNFFEKQKLHIYLRITHKNFQTNPIFLEL